jgi:hypothetical protein
MKMNRPLLKRVIPQVMAWVGLIVLCAVVAIAQDTGSAASRSDGQIEMDVVQALDASQTLKDDLITAATIQNEVTLSGTVSSNASSQLAESIAAKVPGVTKVHNKLKVGNPQQAAEEQNLQNTQAQNQTDADTTQSAESQPSAQQQTTNQGQYQSPQQGQYPQQQDQYPQQSSYPPARPQYAPPPQYGDQPQYAQNQPAAPSYEVAKSPMTVPPGTLLQVRTSEPVDSKRATPGTPVQFVVINDVALGNFLAIPRGAIVRGVVTDVRKTNSGDLGGSPELALSLTSLELGGQSYPLNSDQFKVKGPNKAGRTVGSAVGGALLGAIIGGAVGRGEGAAIGAGAGAATGTVASAASPGPGIWIPAEALVTFHLSAPLTVNPVSRQEAARLAQGLYQGGPSLYQRNPNPGRPYDGAPYAAPYGYPPVYYRPYYVVGGSYYWR